MPRMLLDNELYRWVEPPLHEKELKEYQRELKKGQTQAA